MTSESANGNTNASILLLVETNFAVGFALEQGQNFDYLLHLSADKRVTLAIPDFCLKEARTTITRQFEGGREALESANNVLQQLARSDYAKNLANTARNVIGELFELLENQRDDIVVTLEHLSAHCHIIPHSPDAFIQGRLRFVGSEAPFIETDCEIYECALNFIRAEADNFDLIIFLNLDREHFDCDDIRDELTSLGVNPIFTTGECIAMLHQVLGMSK